MTWRDEAACRGEPTETFFPARGDVETLERAKAICAACPVRGECAAESVGEIGGVWGGMSARERKARRTRRAA